MNIRTKVSKSYALVEAECRKFVRFYINESDWQNTIELSERFIPRTFASGSAVISLTDLTEDSNPIKYKISGHLSYNPGGDTPVMISLPFSKDSERREKELEKMVQNSSRLLVEIEQTRDEER